MIIRKSIFVDNVQVITIYNFIYVDNISIYNNDIMIIKFI